jgi:hypothetical protein
MNGNGYNERLATDFADCTDYGNGKGEGEAEAGTADERR